ncbi:acylneuraminate cytidylyltransferase family protein [Flavobacterium sp. CYK-4]|uniref:acylneuraminate cytidylyltransferase family protein n=1 Tax=Flavobacterium lotistagni TaxID=2709660 RepID=UPI00140B963A|nr:acylneuraminate cytidylyltransferase family protein [Flavobacterium lotistagni]NHM06412.1 acylneuraminate cytidylyltransferase family protein [Flavobacterium lotistagni]
MKNIAIIPARGGSKRLPGKNTMPLGGLPLIAHSIKQAKEFPAIIDEVYVSTDDNSIKEVALVYGAKVIDRPAALSGDEAPTVSALKHVLQNIEHEVGCVFLLQPTNPLRPKNLIAEAYELYEQHQPQSLMTVTRNHQKFGKIIDHQFVPFNYEIGQRSQDLEPLYFENGLLYLIKPKLILEEKILGVPNFAMIVNHPFASVDIDTQDDFDYAAYLLNQFPLKK